MIQTIISPVKVLRCLIHNVPSSINRNPWVNIWAFEAHTYELWPFQILNVKAYLAQEINFKCSCQTFPSVSTLKREKKTLLHVQLTYSPKNSRVAIDCFYETAGVLLPNFMLSFLYL